MLLLKSVLMGIRRAQAGNKQRAANLKPSSAGETKGQLGRLKKPTQIFQKLKLITFHPWMHSCHLLLTSISMPFLYRGEEFRRESAWSEFPKRLGTS